MQQIVQSIREDIPGSRWQMLFERFWPSYQKWFLSEGHLARPGYVTCRKKLRQHMPELAPVYERLTELAGGGDLAARFLSLYDPPPFMTGCSQAVWDRGDPFLVRNYDYDPRLFEGVLLYTDWTRPVIAMSDCLWGALDGINDAGLTASLAFGGRKIVGHGFGVPLVLRYILETCETTREAVDVLARIPVHMSYNVTVLDRSGDFNTAFLSPDRPAMFCDLQAITNQQQFIEWEEYNLATASDERKSLLKAHLRNGLETPEVFTARFLRPPLYSTRFEQAFGTLYTAVYTPQSSGVEFHWPDNTLRQSIADFCEQKTIVNFTSIGSSFKRKSVS